MTGADEVYADWLNLLGSDEIDDTNEDTIRDLHQMHVSAEVSHHGPGCIGDPGHIGPCPQPDRPEYL